MAELDVILGAKWRRRVDAWPEVIEERRGRRVKIWIKAPDGSVWLRKLPLDWRTSEPPIEVAMLRLARAADIPAADAFVAEWTENGNHRRGIAVKKFLNDESQTMAMGAEVMQGYDADFDPLVHEAHTVPRVRQTLERLEREYPGAWFIEPFVAVALFDAWIGNGDRHSENWAVVYGADKPAFSPMYDPASCLGTGLHEIHTLIQSPTEPGLAQYAANCKSGFGDGEKVIKLAAVVEALWEWPEFQSAAPSALARFRKLLDTFVDRLLGGIEADLLSDARKAFARRLLVTRLEWLERTVTELQVKKADDGSPV